MISTLYIFDDFDSSMHLIIKKIVYSVLVMELQDQPHGANPDYHMFMSTKGNRIVGVCDSESVGQWDWRRERETLVIGHRETWKRNDSTFMRKNAPKFKRLGNQYRDGRIQLQFIYCMISLSLYDYLVPLSRGFLPIDNSNFTARNMIIDISLDK